VSRSRVGRPTGLRHARRGPIVLAIASIAALAVVSAAGAGAKATIGNVTPVPGGAVENFTPAVTPFGVSKAMATYVVQLSGDPVSVADANSKDNGNGPLSQGQKDSLAQQLKAAQAPVLQQVQALGGKVIASFQNVYNGVAVQVPQNKVAQLESLTGVTNVYRSLNHTISNIHGVPLVQGPQTWGGTPGFTGLGMKIADIDTGIDYTHADFGGPGTVSAWLNASSQSTADATSTSVCMTPQLTPCFGPNAPKVKGGTDLVGNDYDAGGTAAQQVPHPDPNPLDCGGHGTHTAGTAAGDGVLANGQTFTGQYNATTVSGNNWNVGPGVAPQASIYSVRVFGCAGSVTDAVLIQAMEWAVDNHMDAINMSLGAPFGQADAPDSAAASNAAKDGVIVVSASGNNGPAPYMTSSPGAANGTLSVAANDPTQGYPGATLQPSTGGSITAINANGFAFSSPHTYNVKVMTPPNNLGCSGPPPAGAPNDYANAGITTFPANTLVVVDRGICARVAKAIYGQDHGAAAVLMVNNAASLPPFEGRIISNPDRGTPADVEIPFFGVSSADGAAIKAADGGTITVTASNISNPLYLGLASFSSAGPRSGDSALKPQVTAPGVSIASAGMGTGNGPSTMSGTSMATPHTAGAALLVKQAHPNWRRVVNWNAAIANTATPSLVSNYNTVGAGSGEIQAYNATHTQVTALADHDTTSLDFGLFSDDKDFNGSEHIKLHNWGTTPVTFNVADTADQGSPHTISLNHSSVTVPGRGDADVQVGLSVPIATAGDSSAFRSVAGLITFTPASGSDNSGIALNVPYLLVPQASSDLKLQHVDNGQFNPKKGQTTVTAPVTLTNDHGAANAVADWFAWGLKDTRDHALKSDDLQAAGMQSFPSAGFLFFAINTAHRWSNPAEDEFDVLVDTNHDGNPDYDVVAADHGLLTAGVADGEDVVAVFNLSTGTGTIRFLATADFNGSTMELPVLFSDLGLTAASQPISYTVESFSQTDGTSDAFTSNATYDVNHPVFSNNSEDVVAPNATVSDPTTVDLTQWAATPQLGLLVFDQNDTGGNDKNEATEIQLNINTHNH
jgi:minor extracellular serine protease Vpr